MKKVNFFNMLLCGITVLGMHACQKQPPTAVTADDPLTNTTGILTTPFTNSLTTDVGREAGDNFNTFYGPTVQVGDGHARSWIIVKRQGDKPVALGIEFNRRAFDNLPSNPLDFAASTFVLPLHQKARALTPYDHITLNWEPHGHEPAGIYDVPHFDMHFYKITVAQQMTISPVPAPAPAPGYLPAQYVIQGATVPQMGMHWLNPASPELPPTLAPFTHTLIYGSYIGGVHFLEPMITRAFLLAGTTVSKAIPQPALVAPGHTWYPTVYDIWMVPYNNRHYVALSGFEWRN